MKSATLIVFCALLTVLIAIFLIYGSLDASTNDSLIIINNNDTYSFNWANPEASSLMLIFTTNHGVSHYVFDGSMVSGIINETNVIQVSAYIQLPTRLAQINIILVASPETITKTYLPMIGA